MDASEKFTWLYNQVDESRKEADALFAASLWAMSFANHELHRCGHLVGCLGREPGRSLVWALDPRMVDSACRPSFWAMQEAMKMMQAEAAESSPAPDYPVAEIRAVREKMEAAWKTIRWGQKEINRLLGIKDDLSEADPAS